jgi:hypothetical protein
LGNPFISTFLFIWEVVSEDDHLFSAIEISVYLFVCWKTEESDMMHVCFLQMSENRRRGERRAQPEQQAPQEDAAQQQQLPPPPPMTVEQMFMMQSQAVQAISQTLAAMQQV